MTSGLSFRLSRAAGTLVAVCAVAFVVSVPVQADTKSELAAAKQKLEGLVERIGDQTSQVEALQSQASEIAGRISAVETRIAETQHTIAVVERDIATAKADIATKQGELDQRARIAYVYGPGSSLEFLLSSKSLGDLTDRLEIVDSAARHDQEIIDAVERFKGKLLAKQRRLRKLEADLAARREQLRVDEIELQAKLADAQTVVNQLRADRAEAESLVEKLEKQHEKELAAAAAAAAAALAAQQQPTSAAAGSPVIGGVFQLCPVDPPRAYSDDFGAPRVGHTHQGNDIFAPYGTPIRAPFSGTASDASNGIGGMSVYVHGSAGYVYNAHLSAMGTLGPVEAGTIIGYVGTSGNAAGTSPHNHFEWHPGGGGAVNPFPYLNSVC